MSTEAATGVEHYRVDAAASTFTVQAFAEGLFSAFGHDPVLGIKDFHGEAEFVPGTFENASLKLSINANSLAVVNDVKEKDRQDIERMMRDEVLETGQYPEIVFQSNNISLSKSGPDRYRARVIGDLTLHGVTQKNIWLNGEVSFTPDGLRAKGDFTLKQSDYKIKLVSVAGGTLKIKNEVKGSFDILARSAG
ncbi:MAG TPA: YceI family protein [Pyrinomonadaceae bacterium]|nr:YceI family protein [Pyrinomonadaceae bacterium]